MPSMKKGARFVCRRCGWTVTACGMKSKTAHAGLCCECHQNNDIYSQLRRLKVPAESIRRWLANGMTRTDLQHIVDGLKSLKVMKIQGAVAKAVPGLTADLTKWGLHA